MATLEDYNHLIRFNLWVPVLAIFIIGYLSARTLFFGPGFFIGAAIVILMTSASITVNHYYDYEFDRKSKDIHRFPVARGKVSRRSAMILSLIFLNLSLALSFFLNTTSQLIILAGIFFVFSYSVPPIRMKTKKILGVIWNGIGYGFFPFYLAVSILDRPINTYMFLLSLIPFLITASGHILLQVRDIPFDRKTKLTTTSAIYGKNAIIKASRIMIALAGLLIIYLWLIRFLNFFALFSILAGVLIVYEHKKMKEIKDITERFRTLQILYLTGGILFILSVL